MTIKFEGRESVNVKIFVCLFAGIFDVEKLRFCLYSFWSSKLLNIFTGSKPIKTLCFIVCFCKAYTNRQHSTLKTSINSYDFYKPTLHLM